MYYIYVICTLWCRCVYYDEMSRCPADGYLQWARFKKIKPSKQRRRACTAVPCEAVTFFAHISTGDTTRKFCDENSLSREQSTISLEACEPALTRATHVFLYAIMYEYKFMQIGRPTSDAVSMHFWYVFRAPRPTPFIFLRSQGFGFSTIWYTYSFIQWVYLHRYIDVFLL